MSKIFDQYAEQRAELVEAYIRPTRITFSTAGYRKMMGEHESGVHHVFSSKQHRPHTYCGLPYLVDRAQQEDIKLHNAMTDAPQPSAVLFRVDHLDPHQTAMQVAGQGLSKAQLCNLISAWTGANPEGPLSAALSEAIIAHGSFE
jgi:hypothetical protein